jgi:hypothetical protein
MSAEKYSTLFYFQNELLSVVEVKRLDLAEDAPLGDVFHWLKIKKTGELSKLSFVSMAVEEIKENMIDVRIFKVGELRFSKGFAKFDDGVNAHILEQVTDNKLSSTLTEKVETYLSSL